ncbi:LysR family transcriptional regulator [Acinetobacter sp. ANC 3813]|uniref:LysR family transcriptional regulator n=1 Tax=Acinetobacter sp. ANC 3813 TaxID=1977873 RepID=UPI000A32E8B5|nr:LysR family transcriptional regulator [Acinetobacter sp. ANC 3813]OTG91960.1 LysR family transcriptional regulator [Acinetobacter sp. ANC 3813]
MELRHLKYFAAVAEYGSFTKAAEQLFTAQPSLSQQIKDLEAEVGVQLIDRSSKQIKLTDEGQAFLKHAINAIESANLASAAARQVAHQKKNQIHIGFLNVAELKIMPLILDKLKRQIPNISIHIQSLTCLEQIHKLKKSELDISFTRYAVQHEDYENIQLMTEKIYLVASKKLHSSSHTVSRSYLSKQSIIMCEQSASPVFYEKINQILALEHLPRTQMHWVTNVLQHINLINMGMGYSFAPEYLLKFLSEDVQVVAVDFEIAPLHLYASFRKGSSHQALQLICNELRITAQPNEHQ